MDRRHFLLSSAGSLGSLSLFSELDPVFTAQFERQLNRLERLGSDEAASDEDFWNWVRSNYTVAANVINLNNGGVSPQPKIVQEAHIRNYQYSNEAPSYYMWRILDQQREGLRNKLADLCGVLPEELAINRNATEGLNTIIFGLNLKAGDEVVLSTFDYPNMMNAWKQREKRDGIKLVWINIPQPFESDEAVIKLYEHAITSRTKVVHITHLINWTGNIVPCKAIADMAHKKGCEVIVDAAHSFGHFEFKLPDTGADYLATALHKWIGAPFGTGLLYIRKEKISSVWALLSAVEPDGKDMKKFESLGTRSFAAEMAIGAAVDFHTTIGAKRKEARLRFLKNYWSEKVQQLPNVNFYTSQKPQQSCAIATTGIEGWQAPQMESWLFDKYKIHSVSILHEKVNGIRISPNVYTSTKDLDFLVKGLTQLSALPAPPAK